MRSALAVAVLAIYPVLFIAAANPGQTSPMAVAAATLAAALAAVALLAIFRFVRRSQDQAGLDVAVLIALFYVYGPVHASFELSYLDALAANAGMARLNTVVARHLHTLLTVCWIGIAWVAFRALGRLADHRVRRATTTMHAMAAILMVMLAGQFLFQGRSASSQSFPDREVHAGAFTGEKPDIYLIVLDGYARNDVLERHYGFSNTTFMEQLRSRGFRISDGSNANYYWTFLALASSLNMDYLQNLFGDRLSPGTRNRTLAYEAIRSSAVHAFLKEQGYRTIHFQSTWGATLENRHADIQVPCQRMLFQNEYFRVLAEASWLKVFQPLASTDLAQCHLANLENLSAFSGLADPIFLFAHFLPPHHPYLFDRDGNVLRQANLSNQFEFQKSLWEERAKYVDQLIFMNDRVIEAIDRIVEGSSRPPIIILQSDHGPNITRGLSAEEQLRVRFANFSAFLMPHAPPSLIPSDVSAVNVFRIVLNHYFHTDLELLDDRYYFSTFNDPYRFRETAAP